MTGPLGRAAVALRLGFATARGRSGAVHRWALVLASFAGVLVAWSFVAASAVADQREQRLLDRGPVYTTDASGAVAYWYDRIDYLRDRQFLVIHVAPIDPGAPPPPGLPRWPRPGETFVSGALAAADERVTYRYGEFAGTIARDGLLDSTEWLIYTRPRESGAFGGTDQNTMISGYGQVGGDFPPAHLPSTIGPAELPWLLLVVAAFPTLVLMVVAVRTGAERRDRRLAMLDGLGAPASARGWMLVGEAAIPVAGGGALGAVVAVVTTLVDTPVPATGLTVWAGDLAGVRWWVPMLWTGVVAGLLTLVALVQLRPGRTDLTRPQSVSPHLRYWPQVVFPLALAATILTATFGAGVGAEFGMPPAVIGFLVSLVVTLGTLPMVASAAVSWLGERIARLGSPSGLVGGRWLAARPMLTARLVAAVAVGLGVTSQLAVIGTIDAYRSGWQPDAASDQAVVVYARGASDAARADFVAAAGTGRVMEIRAGADRYTPILVGDCEALDGVGDLTGCPDGPLPTVEVFSGATAIERAVMLETELVASEAPPDTEPWGFLVLNPDGPAGVERLQHLAHRTLPLATAHAAGQLARAVEPSMTIRLRWAYAAGAVGILLLACAGAVAMLSLVAAQARSLGALGGIGAPAAMFARTAWWNVGLPLLLMLGGSVAMAAFLAQLAVRLRGSGEIPWSFLGVSAVICFVLAVLMTAAAAFLTARAAPNWRPTGD